MSVEFHALEERTTAGGVREVLRALVPSAALVADPEYDTTEAEVRRRIGGVRSGFTEGEALDCRCGPVDCDTATIGRGALVIPDGTPAFLSTFEKPLGPATVARDGAKVHGIGRGAGYVMGSRSHRGRGGSPHRPPVPTRAGFRMGEGGPGPAVHTADGRGMDLRIQ